MNKQVTEILDNYATWFPWKPDKLKASHLEQATKEATQAIETLLTEERRVGFLGAMIACSYDKDCKSCKANRLTLAHLAKEENL